MANLANALKEEIGRLARKEIRQQTAGTAKSTAQCERDIAALKRQVQDLQRKLSSLRTQDAPKQTVSKRKTSKETATKQQDEKAAAPTSAKQSSARARFSAKGLKTSRERLGLSADNYGKLVGVSGLSIYNWEQGKARPRESSVEALMSIRGIGKREAARRLGTLAKPKAKGNRAPKASRAASEGQAKSED